MAKKAEFSVEDRLRALYDLQLIHSRIDKIRSVRGELPLEVEDLEDEVAGLEVRISKLEEDSKKFTDDIKSKEIATEHAKSMIKKYNEQQKNVRNNRAFESLSKEIEFQELEIELCAKQINELKAQIELKNQSIAENNQKLEERREHLKHKKDELGDILKETEKEENDLLKKSTEFESKIDESLLISYKKIRSSVRNGLAVVAVERGASAGSFFTIPPQVQLDIASRKKFITDEHSGRILVDKELAEEENEKMAKLFTSI
jgi:predicted  nucleic acid-binding Zn-ribbon protein